jgi:hypothetical protein
MLLVSLYTLLLYLLCLSRAQLSRNETNEHVFNGSLMDVECIEQAVKLSVNFCCSNLYIHCFVCTVYDQVSFSICPCFVQNNPC